MTKINKLLLASPLFVGTLQSQTVAKPNVVFILSDDMGWGDISCHGHERFRTPHIDDLAKNGIDFHQFYVANPISSPSRCGMMTGNFPIRYGIHRQLEMALNVTSNQVDWLDPTAPTLAKALQGGGYETAHFGKWHLVEEASAAGSAADAPRVENYGFDVAEPMRGPWPGLGTTLPKTDSRTVYDKAVNYINATHNKPFYVQVWTHEPHVPVTPTTAGYDANAHVLDLNERKYAGVITDEDNGVGRIIAALKSKGLYENTIVVFASDNGPAKLVPTSTQDKYNFGTTGGRRGTKGTLYQGGIRTPLIVSWPSKLPKGKVNKVTQMAGVDLFPTICGLTETTLPVEFAPDGENMKSACEGNVVQRTKPLFWFYVNQYAVISGDYKLITDGSYSASTMELYDLVKDTAEVTNLKNTKPDIVNALKQKIVDYRKTLPSAINPACVSKYSSRYTNIPTVNNQAIVKVVDGVVTISGYETANTITIVDFNGRVVINQAVKQGDLLFFNLPKGIYIIKELNKKIVVN